MNISDFVRSIALILPIVTGSACAADKAANADTSPVKVVYHISEGIAQAENGLRNIKNHIEVDPTAKIVVVAIGNGADFLIRGAKTRNGELFSKSVEDLSLWGVEFRICEITIQRNNIDPATVLSEAKPVPSGVVEVARLQAKEHYAYLKP